MGFDSPDAITPGFVLIRDSKVREIGVLKDESGIIDLEKELRGFVKSTGESCMAYEKHLQQKAASTSRTLRWLESEKREE